MTTITQIINPAPWAISQIVDNQPVPLVKRLPEARIIDQQLTAGVSPLAARQIAINAVEEIYGKPSTDNYQLVNTIIDF